MTDFHASSPIHHVKDGFGFKREGETIIVYPGRVDGTLRLSLDEWASVVAFTTPEGGNSKTFEEALALVTRGAEASRLTNPVK